MVINTTSEFESKKKVYFSHFKFYEQLKFHAHLSMILFYNLRVQRGSLEAPIETKSFHFHGEFSGKNQ